MPDRQSESQIQCPMAKEFQQARKSCPVLASTGCSKDFCQAGRAVHTDEPRIGENRALEVVETEAEGFLRELHQEKFFDSEHSFRQRLDDVVAEIRAGISEGPIRNNKQRGRIGGTWKQTRRELEFGIRRSWRNARKCIMRSHSDELKLCDLRDVTSSAQMATELIQGVSEAYNGGNIVPTVFAFPPREANRRGPMIWNHQLLEFAGYEMEHGSILGDPASVTLTKAIIELGWEPPSLRSRWDLLPLVVMADGDVPALAELPQQLCQLVQIRHPRHKEFEELDLKWVAFPALTRLGFDIGGVQYTAAPFIGWFMDAEIGVRDLADTFRYNALPEAARVLGLLDAYKEAGIEDIEDLQEYERLSVLQKAQTELTYAVHWSYQQARVTMSDTFKASEKWCRYDDDFKEKNGFRLPADPYWLAPPQGSIVPVWHRGGAPNYQPKPMICKHVQDPLKAWEREKQAQPCVAKPVIINVNNSSQRPKAQSRAITNSSVTFTSKKRQTQKGMALSLKLQIPKWLNGLRPKDDGSAHRDTRRSQALRVTAYYCSAGTLAEKIALKLHLRLQDLAKTTPQVSVCSQLETLNRWQASVVDDSDIILIVASSTGQGEIPPNGNGFVSMCDEIAQNRPASPKVRFRYAVLGNGDSRYAATYNGAALSIERGLRSIGGLALAGGLYQSDTAVRPTALQVLNPWWAKLQPCIQELATDSHKFRGVNRDSIQLKNLGIEDAGAQTRTRFESRAKRLQTDFREATLVNTSPAPQQNYQGTHLLTLDIKNRPYNDMDCIQLLPINQPAKVRRALRALGLNGSAKVELGILGTTDPTYSTFLTEYIDLEAPFYHFDWLKSFPNASVSEGQLSSLPSLEGLERLNNLNVLPCSATLTKSITLAFPLLHPRTYSLASSASYASPPHRSRPVSITPNHLEILVKPLSLGRFSNTFLSSPAPTSLRYRLLPSAASSLLTFLPSTPLIIVATGAGFAPVRCLLQRRIAACRTPSSSSAEQSGISLFLGLKQADVPLLSGILNEAAAAGVLESMSIVSSNEEKVRVYDRLLEEGTREKARRKIIEEKGYVFLCTNPEAARGTREAFEEVFGKGVVQGLGKRWIEEVF